MSSRVTNHSLPSAAFAKVGPKEEGDTQGKAPSVASQSVGSTRRVGSGDPGIHLAAWYAEQAAGRVQPQ